MADGDSPGHGDLYGCGLLLDSACPVDQAVFDETISGVIGRLWARRFVDIAVVLTLAVLEEGIANGIRVAYEGDSVGAAVVDVTAADRDAAVVVVDEDRVAAELVELAID